MDYTYVSLDPANQQRMQGLNRRNVKDYMERATSFGDTEGVIGTSLAFAYGFGATWLVKARLSPSFTFLPP